MYALDTLENLDFYEPKKFEKRYYLEDLDNLETLDPSQMGMASKGLAVWFFLFLLVLNLV